MTYQEFVEYIKFYTKDGSPEEFYACIEMGLVCDFTGYLVLKMGL